jgi:hypothetical protein
MLMAGFDPVGDRLLRMQVIASSVIVSCCGAGYRRLAPVSLR